MLSCCVSVRERWVYWRRREAMSTVAAETTAVTAAWRGLENRKKPVTNLRFLRRVCKQSSWAIVLMKLKPIFCTKEGGLRYPSKISSEKMGWTSQQEHYWALCFLIQIADFPAFDFYAFISSITKRLFVSLCCKDAAPFYGSFKLVRNEEVVTGQAEKIRLPVSNSRLKRSSSDK